MYLLRDFTICSRPSQSFRTISIFNYQRRKDLIDFANKDWILDPLFQEVSLAAIPTAPLSRQVTMCCWCSAQARARGRQATGRASTSSPSTSGTSGPGTPQTPRDPAPRQAAALMAAPETVLLTLTSTSARWKRHSGGSTRPWRICCSSGRVRAGDILMMSISVKLSRQELGRSGN